MFSIQEYDGVLDKEYQFRCNTCNDIFISKMEDGDIPRCYTCYPVNGSSVFEKEVYEYICILTDGVECNNKTILKGKVSLLLQKWI